MTTFKGFDDWIEIFKGGPVTDSAGTEHDGDELIDKALAAFDPSNHEPPVVIGHPEDNAPAYAWVEKIKKGVRDGATVLLAKFKQVVPEFEKMVRDGLFKKRSPAFYPEGGLRHVGFLGAAPPARKGMKDIDFGDTKNTITFEEAITIMGDKDTKTFTEADIQREAEKAADAARKEEREKMQLEFAETRAQEKRDAARAQNREWVEAKVKDGTIPPVIAKLGIAEFMDALATEGEFEFAEGRKQAPAGWFKEFVEELFEGSFSHLFSEFATKGKASDGKEDETEFPPNLTSKV